MFKLRLSFQIVALFPPFTANIIGITRVGKMVILYPQDEAWEIFDTSESVTDDFCDAILESRQSNENLQRVSL
ncbi:MAG: hypothetical protein FWF78_01645 [Defluviitaleaceae bacterium]|nr:hypothetical protein [Defluviitaleaceae bacterium]